MEKCVNLTLKFHNPVHIQHVDSYVYVVPKSLHLLEGLTAEVPAAQTQQEHF